METLILTKITPPAGQPLPAKIKIGADLDWLVCKEICLPGKASLDLNVSSQPKDNIDLQGLFDEIRREMPIRIPALPVRAKAKGDFLEFAVQSSTDVGSLNFFPEEGDYVDEFRPAETKTEGSRQILRIPLKKDAQLPDIVTGILVAEKPWDSSGHRALEISIPLKSPSTSTSGLPLIFLFAFLGGLILNVMPCV